MSARCHRLGPDFYLGEDVVAIARTLLGKILATSIDGRRTRAVITETEAYAGITDRASHAFGGRRTRRTEPLFAAGGIAYVYLCYGIHHLFNVVTGPEGVPHAVLVRAGAPLDGIDTMLARRGRARVDARLMAGPGTLSCALGIRTSMTGTALGGGNRIRLEDHGIEVPAGDIRSGPRVGIDYAGPDAALPYRFRLTGAALRKLAGAA
ncbi:MAG: DNA-3-methyladenine glycosylase [Woeseiaceae bacterium]|nr:DNA-3-methyladenine glycosylase [Woeseiaceae bacterium]